MRTCHIGWTRVKQIIKDITYVICNITEHFIYDIAIYVELRKVIIKHAHFSNNFLKITLSGKKPSKATVVKVS